MKIRDFYASDFLNSKKDQKPHPQKIEVSKELEEQWQEEPPRSPQDRRSFMPAMMTFPSTPKEYLCGRPCISFNMCFDHC